MCQNHKAEGIWATKWPYEKTDFIHSRNKLLLRLVIEILGVVSALAYSDIVGGHGEDVTKDELDPGNPGLFAPSPLPEMYTLPSVPTCSVIEPSQYILVKEIKHHQ